MVEFGDEEDGGTGAGADPDETGQGGDDGNSEGDGGDGASGEGEGNAGGAGVVDRSKLNPLLRGMPEEQINEVFETLFEAVRNKGGDNSGVPAHAREAEPAKPVKAPTRDQMKEMLDPNSENFNPEAAFKQFVDANYGGLIGDIGNNALAGMLNAVKSELPDFAKYEKDINTVLSKAPAGSINKGFIVDTYFRVKGFRQTEKELEETRRPPTTRKPSPGRQDDSKPGDKLSDEELVMARRMFRNSADPAAEWKKATALMDKNHVRVPGDPRPKPKVSNGGKK